MTQEKLAQVVGIDRTTVARIELGKQPLVGTAIRLARAVDRRVEDLWGHLAPARRGGGR